MRRRSSGEAHGKAVRLGIMKARIATAGSLSVAMSSDKVDLIRNVFGKFNAVATSCGMHISQNMVLFRQSDGSVAPFDYASETSAAMLRQKSIGIFSHLFAQQDALARFLKANRPRHAIVSCKQVVPKSDFEGFCFHPTKYLWETSLQFFFG